MVGAPMLKAERISRSGPKLSDAQTRNFEAIKYTFEGDGRGARGYRFVREVVARRAGPVSEKLVRRSMREQGLRPVWLRRRRRYSSYWGEADAGAPNLLLREDGTHDFSASRPNERWASDITEFALPCGDRVRLSLVVDLFDGRPAGWALGTSPDADLANSSLDDAISRLAPGESPLMHADRGCHYRWPGWKERCEAAGIARSMSRKSTSPDNAACEGFFGTLKNEAFHGRDWEGWIADEFIVLMSAHLEGWGDGEAQGVPRGRPGRLRHHRRPQGEARLPPGRPGTLDCPRKCPQSLNAVRRERERAKTPNYTDAGRRNKTINNSD